MIFWNDLKRKYKDPQKIATNQSKVCCDKIAEKVIFTSHQSPSLALFHPNHPMCVVAFGKDMQKVKDHPFWSRPDIKLYLKGWMDSMVNVRTIA